MLSWGEMDYYKPIFYTIVHTKFRPFGKKKNSTEKLYTKKFIKLMNFYFINFF